MRERDTKRKNKDTIPDNLREEREINSLDPPPQQWQTMRNHVSLSSRSIGSQVFDLTAS